MDREKPLRRIIIRGEKYCDFGHSVIRWHAVMPQRRSSSKVSSRLALDRKVGADFRIVGKRIGAGNFGEVRIGENVRTGEKVAVKIELTDSEKSSSNNNHHHPAGLVSLRHEYEMLRRVYHGYPRGQKINGIPRVHHFDRCGSADCMVIDLLGPNLEDLFEMLQYRFSLKTVLMIAFQMLDRIEQVHKRGLVYRDVKPENFLLGRRESRERNIIHLVDFGLATYYRDPVTSRHLPYRDLKTMTGTARYMSINSHLGKLQSRRDDLESVGYVIIYFAHGGLPWQGLKTANVKEKYRKIRDAKMRTSLKELCKGLPSQMVSYMTYVRKMSFTEEPDYEYLKDLFHSLYEENGYSYDDAMFDWSYMDLPSDVGKFNRALKENGSCVSSVDTEADGTHLSDTDVHMDNLKVEECLSRRKSEDDHREEAKDALGDLKNIVEQTKAMGAMRGSRRSLKTCVNSVGVLFGEDVSDAGFSVRMDNTSSSTLEGAKSAYFIGGSSASQGYYSYNDIDDLGRFGSKVSSSIGSKPAESAIRPRVESEATSVKDQRDNNAEVCHCTEASFTEERVTFLCFTWKRRKKGMTTYHPCGRCQQGQGHRTREEENS